MKQSKNEDKPNDKTLKHSVTIGGTVPIVDYGNFTFSVTLEFETDGKENVEEKLLETVQTAKQAIGREFIELLNMPTKGSEVAADVSEVIPVGVIGLQQRIKGNPMAVWLIEGGLYSSFADSEAFEAFMVEKDALKRVAALKHDLEIERMQHEGLEALVADLKDQQDVLERNAAQPTPMPIIADKRKANK